MPALLDLTPDVIGAHPSNPRDAVGDVSDLVASITAHGILEPLIVAPGDGAKTYILIAGHRRLAAATQAGLVTVPCLLREDLDTLPRQLEAMLIENTQRSDLTPVEEGKAYQFLLEFPGYTLAKVVQGTGRSRATVRSRIALTKLSAGTKERITAGQITLEQAEVIAKHAANPAAVKELEKAAGTHSWEYAKERVQRVEKSEAAVARAIKKAAAEGLTVFPTQDLPEGWMWKSNASVVPLAQLEVAKSEHRANCPGHAIVIERGYDAARITAICTTPQAHPPADADEAAAAEAQRQQEAREEELKEGLAVAATVRRAHLSQFLQSDAASVDVLAYDIILVRTLRALDRKSRSNAHHLALEILGAQGATELEAKTRKLNLQQLVVLGDIVDNAVAEMNSMPKVNGWRYGSGDWQRRLTEVYGWEFTPGETAVIEHIAAIDQARAAARAADDEDDLEDEDQDDVDVDAEDIADHRGDIDCPEPETCIDRAHYAVA